MGHSNSSGGGLGTGGVLGIVFIVLKLTHVIDWSWWWVLAPFWIGFLLVLLLAVLALLAAWLESVGER